LKLYPDLDRDGAIDRSGEPIYACLPLPAAYLDESHPDDCDDTEPKRNISALELCNGIDDDCDEKVDTEDEDMFEEYDQADTTFACSAGRWEILACPVDRLWCTVDVVQFGCTIDATSLDNCRACGATCGFSCGLEGCDDVEDLALGDAMSCARTHEGNVACWGWGDAGRLGNGSERSSFEPLEVDVSGAHLLAAGPANGCVTLGEQQELQCWGNNSDGVLGTGDLNRLIDPDPGRVVGGNGEPAMVGVISVGIGPAHACAATATGEAFCWGNTTFGRVGNNIVEEEILAPRRVQRFGGPVVTDAQSVVAGERHSCLLTTSGAVECWGSNTAGQLGDPDFADVLFAQARPVPGLTASQIDAGSRHTCALRDGEVLCWGSNANLQLGREGVELSAEPAVVAGLSNVTRIAIGGKFGCALDDAGAVWCWGVNELGERGDDDPDDRATPVRVLNEGIVAISAGDFNVCVVNEAHETYCWGDNYYGQLGTGSTDDLPQPNPQLVKPLRRRR
jgi:alpha-tubulin suppressor-like RCC1 family protein